MANLIRFYIAFLLLIIAASDILANKPKRFDNYRVYSINIENEQQKSAIDGLWRVLSEGVDYWKGANTLNTMADLMIAPGDQTQFESVLVNNDFKWKLKVENVQNLIDAEQPTIMSRDGEMDWTAYHTFEEIMDWMDGLLETYPDQLTNIVIGNSVEGRVLRGLKLSRRAGNKAILIESNTHAREWITAATTTHFLNSLLTATTGNLALLANNYDWYIFPIANPDGYVYSWTTNRMWRKNRSRHGFICLGTDPNRNWGYQWATGVTGSSDDVCQETYTGPSAFSEPETRHLADFIMEHIDSIKMFLSFHSYSQLLLYPFSYTDEPVPERDFLHEICQITADAIESVHGTPYTVQASYHLCKWTIMLNLMSLFNFLFFCRPTLWHECRLDVWKCQDHNVHHV